MKMAGNEDGKEGGKGRERMKIIMEEREGRERRKRENESK
jgi:hypothetical protein